VGIIFSTSGCYNLRKKFVRKKKYQKEEPVYINFKDYPQKPTREAYIDYFLFVKGWLDELQESLDRGYSIKREKRAINNAIMNLEQIMSFYNDQGKEKAYPLYRDLVAVKNTIEKNPNKNKIERDYLNQRIDHFRRKFEAEFNYTEAGKWMQ
jgi:hypothetical protein